ncbi:MAG: BLUF domain-containing protein [Pseudomonadota bacterium]
MPYQLIYASRSSHPLVPAEVKTLLQRSRSSNEQTGVTGALILHNGQFLQLLEGDASTVCKLYQHILQDPLHEHAVQLAFSEVSRPYFAGWSMGLLSGTAGNRKMFLQHVGGESFNPMALDAAGATELFDLIHKNVHWLS